MPTSLIKGETMNKKWWKSKTLWINVIAIVGILAFGVETVDPEIQGTILAAINFILRLITKEAVEW